VSASSPFSPFCLAACGFADVAAFIRLESIERTRSPIREAASGNAARWSGYLSFDDSSIQRFEHSTIQVST
jgi:hypothetical protein